MNWKREELELPLREKAFIVFNTIHVLVRLLDTL
jgi:hypothetical protein